MTEMPFPKRQTVERENDMLYHVSPTPGLKVLTPKISTHKKAYVYATDNKVTGILFGAQMDDFDFIISEDEQGIPELYECYPNAFALRYKGRRCSVYTVREDGFLRGVTSWSPELVCETDVEILEETEVSDIYRYLLEEETNHHIRIHRYEKTAAYKAMVAQHIVDRLIRFEIDLKDCQKTDERFAGCYSDLIQALIQVMDGHLLC